VSTKKLVLIGLAVIFALSSLFMVACGGGDDTAAKDAMKAALTKVNADIAGLTQQMMSGGTAADVKAAKGTIEPDWQAVVDACADLKGADAAKAQQLWDAVSAAIDGVAADADLTTLATAVVPAVNELKTYADELAELVGLDTTVTTGAAQ
jgi:chromosome condensin MukBEF complex kleisin-like MukF subunit